MMFVGKYIHKYKQICTYILLSIVLFLFVPIEVLYFWIVKEVIRLVLKEMHLYITEYFLIFVRNTFVYIFLENIVRMIFIETGEKQNVF